MIRSHVSAPSLSSRRQDLDHFTCSRDRPIAMVLEEGDAWCVKTSNSGIIMINRHRISLMTKFADHGGRYPRLAV
jgi:hypothetical protein